MTSDDDAPLERVDYLHEMTKSRPSKLTNDELSELAGYLDDDNNNVRALAAAALGQIADEEVDAVVGYTEKLANRLDGDEDKSVRALAAKALGQIADGETDTVVDYGEELANRLDDEYESVRRNAAVALAVLADTERAAVMSYVDMSDSSVDKRMDPILTGDIVERRESTTEEVVKRRVARITGKDDSPRKRLDRLHKKSQSRPTELTNDELGELAGYLDHDHKSVRAVAAWALTEVAVSDGERVAPFVDELAFCLVDKHRIVRRNAAWALARIAESDGEEVASGVNEVAACMNYESVWALANAAWVLTEVAKSNGDEVRTRGEDLVIPLDNKNIVKTDGKLNNEKYEEWNPEAVVGWERAMSAWESADEVLDYVVEADGDKKTSYVDTLANYLDNDESVWVRANVAWALGEVANTDRAEVGPHVGALANHLDDDEHESVRALAARVLALVAEGELEKVVGNLDSLADCLDDNEHKSVQRNAAWALGEVAKLDGAAVVRNLNLDALASRLDGDEHKRVQEKAAWALAALAETEEDVVASYVDTLANCLDDKHESVQRNAAYALGRIGSLYTDRIDEDTRTAVIEILTSQVDHSDVTVRIQVLKTIADLEAVEALNLLNKRWFLLNPEITQRTARQTADDIETIDDREKVELAKAIHRLQEVQERESRRARQRATEAEEDKHAADEDANIGAFEQAIETYTEAINAYEEAAEISRTAALKELAGLYEQRQQQVIDRRELCRIGQLRDRLEGTVEELSDNPQAAKSRLEGILDRIAKLQEESAHQDRLDAVEQDAREALWCAQVHPIYKHMQEGAQHFEEGNKLKAKDRYEEAECEIDALTLDRASKPADATDLDELRTKCQRGSENVLESLLNPDGLEVSLPDPPTPDPTTKGTEDQDSFQTAGESLSDGHKLGDAHGSREKAFERNDIDTDAAPEALADYPGITVGIVTEERGDDRTIVVKEPKLFEGQEETFRRRAKIWNSLSPNDNIATLIEWGDEPHPWLAMEYLDISLQDRLNRGDEITIREAVVIVERIASAIAHMHDRGFVHCDIKPSNILFKKGELDSPILSDLEHVRDPKVDGRDLTNISPEHAPPEFIGKYESKPQPQSDWYQLGLIFHELVTGEKRPNGEVEVQLPTLPSRVVKSVEELLGDLLEDDPNKRPPDNEVVTELSEIRQELWSWGIPGARRPLEAHKADVTARIETAKRIVPKLAAQEETEQDPELIKWCYDDLQWIKQRMEQREALATDDRYEGLLSEENEQDDKPGYPKVIDKLENRLSADKDLGPVGKNMIVGHKVRQDVKDVLNRTEALYAEVER